MMTPLPKACAELRYRVVEVPALDEHATNLAAAHRVRMLPVLAAAHANSQVVVTCWARSRPHGPVAVVVGGAIEPSPELTIGGDVHLTFPGGARARPVDSADVQAMLGRLSKWVTADVAVDATRHTAAPAGPLLEEVFGLVVDRPMAFIVIGRPVTDVEVALRIDVLSDRVDTLEAHRKGRGTERLRLARAEAELAYLEDWSAQGCWEIEVWTGSDSAEGCRALAATLATGGDVVGTALRIRPASSQERLRREWSQQCIIGADGLAALARPPGRELPGVRVVALPDFDLNVESRADVSLGTVLDATRAPSGAFGVSLESLNRHSFVCGATGSGKSRTVRALLAQLSARSVPWLVIEPAKAEYAVLADQLPAGSPFLVIRPGDPAVPPPALNPLEPTAIDINGVRRQFPLQTHLDLVRALFTAAFEAEEPFPQILGSALTRAYEDLGWNLAVGRALSGPVETPPRWPTLSDLQRHALTVVDELGYGRDVRDNVRGFVRVRIDSLRTGTPGRFFEGGHPLDLERMLAAPTVFEIEDLGDDNDKAFFMGTVIIRIVELLRLRHAAGAGRDALAHVLVIEEAHRLLRRSQPGTPAEHAVTMFANLLAEVRAYGEGLIIAEQIPTKVLPDVVKNSAVKIMHRLPAEDDRAFVGSTMNLTATQSTHVVSLAPGHAVSHVDGMDRPVLVSIDSPDIVRSTARPTTPPPVGLRSPACPSSCGGSPCTLEELEVARNLYDHQRLQLWVEVVVVAHLTGEPIGTPRGPWFDRLASGHSARIRCAIGVAIDDSVDRRSKEIRLSYPPDRLKEHLGGILAQQLSTGRGLARPQHVWRIGQYRFADIARLLTADSGQYDPGAPHPMTDEWRRRGIDLPGADWATQLQQLQDAASVHILLDSRGFRGDPFALDFLAANLGVGSTSEERLRDAVAQLGLDSTWIVHRIDDSWHR